MAGVAQAGAAARRGPRAPGPGAAAVAPAFVSTNNDECRILRLEGTSKLKSTSDVSSGLKRFLDDTFASFDHNCVLVPV